jgi:hypothetical protein
MRFLFDDSSFWSIFFAVEFLILVGLVISIWVFFIKYAWKLRKSGQSHAANDHVSHTEVEEIKQRVATLEAKLKQMESRPA